MQNHPPLGPSGDLTQARRSALSVIATILVPFVLMAPGGAHAAFEVPFLMEIGCPIVQWMKGPLAIMIFVMVVVATLVMGMIMKMDWGKIITVTLILGIVTALGGVLANSSVIQRAAGLSACLQ